ncbi:hypothetical protein D1872_312210 [compost metagenome]
MGQCFVHLFGYFGGDFRAGLGRRLNQGGNFHRFGQRPPKTLTFLVGGLPAQDFIVQLPDLPKRYDKFRGRRLAWA